MKRKDAINPTHYKDLEIYCPHCGKKLQPYVFTGALIGHRAMATKYLTRAGKKDDEIQDIKKAIRFLQFEIERLELRKKYGKSHKTHGRKKQ